MDVPFRHLRTDLPLGGHQFPAGHPQIGQGKRGQHLSGVLRQAAIADLGVPELALDESEGVLTFARRLAFQVSHRSW